MISILVNWKKINLVFIDGNYWILPQRKFSENEERKNDLSVRECLQNNVRKHWFGITHKYQKTYEEIQENELIEKV